MNKKIGLILVLSIMFIGVKVDAASFNMTLNTASQEVEKDSVVDIYITLENIMGMSDGINACWFNLDYDSNKIIINQVDSKDVSGENGWQATQGNNIVMDGNPINTNTIIGKINAKIIDSSSINIKNIECSDSINDIKTIDNTLTINVKQQEIENNITNDLNNNDNYNSSNTVNNEKLGIKEFSITFLLISIMMVILIKIVSKKDLFKKI